MNFFSKLSYIYVFLCVTTVYTASGADRISVVRDVQYLEATRSEKLDIYMPADLSVSNMHPGFVCIHGGGWMNLSKSEGRSVEICTTLAKAGFVALSIDYKMGPGSWPTDLYDCKNAVRFLKSHAKEYNVDPSKIAVGGGSAGGHLALMVGFTAGEDQFEPADSVNLYPSISSNVQAVIDMYGPSSVCITNKTHANLPYDEREAKIAERLAVFGATSDQSDVLRLASPINYISEKSPPVLILHGSIDPNVELAQSINLSEKLKQYNVPYQLVIVKGAGHSFDFETWKQKPLVNDLRPLALGFLTKYLKL